MSKCVSAVPANICELPVPPSANRLWRVFRGHAVRSADFNRWLDSAVDAMKRHLAPVSGQVTVEITIFGGKGLTVRSDLDNFAKPIMDALKPPSFDRLGKLSKAGASIIEDDCLEFVKSIRLVYRDREKKSKAEAVCHVRVEEFQGW